jgi:hypothetical protein
VKGCGGRIDLLKAALKFLTGVDGGDINGRERGETDRYGVSADPENELGKSVMVSCKLVVESHLDTGVDVV